LFELKKNIGKRRKSLKTLVRITIKRPKRIARKYCFIYPLFDMLRIYFFPVDNEQDQPQQQPDLQQQHEPQQQPDLQQQNEQDQPQQVGLDYKNIDSYSL
jgi:hypothetical protein